MSPFHTIQSVLLPKPVSPAHQAWIAAAAALALAFSIEVQGEDLQAHLRDGVLLQLAADLIWRDTAGDPSWAVLDVEKFLRDHGGPEGGRLYSDAVITVLAFCTWLVNHQHISYHDARPVFVTLEPRVNEVLREMRLAARYSVARGMTASPPASPASLN